MKGSIMRKTIKTTKDITTKQVLDYFVENYDIDIQRGIIYGKRGNALFATNSNGQARTTVKIEGVAKAVHNSQIIAYKAGIWKEGCFVGHKNKDNTDSRLSNLYIYYGNKGGNKKRHSKSNNGIELPEVVAVNKKSVDRVMYQVNHRGISYVVFIVGDTCLSIYKETQTGKLVKVKKPFKHVFGISISSFMKGV